MIWTVDAIFDGGVLRPIQELPLADHQRVRVTVEPVSGSTNGSHETADRDEAMKHLLDLLSRSTFRSTGAYPTRDELHDR